MPYDPEKHHRRSIRLKGYDYTQPGAYFVTIHAHREVGMIFGDVVDGVMQLNGAGQIADDCWRAIPEHFDYVTLDVWVVMPNHMHGILVFDDCTGEAMPLGRGEAMPRPYAAGAPAGSLGVVVGAYKSAVTKRINIVRDTPGGVVWQRNYYEHIIRNERALQTIQAYIINNPARWAVDRYNPAATGSDADAAEIWRMLQEPLS